MAYSVPDFNLVCDIYTVTPPSTLTLRVTIVCNLAMGRRIAIPWDQGVPTTASLPMQPMLLLPALTDVRSGICGVSNDVVECPAGSGRWYVVAGVDDVAKGFPNEYRMASLRQIDSSIGWGPYGIPDWPIPIP